MCGITLKIFKTGKLRFSKSNPYVYSISIPYADTTINLLLRRLRRISVFPLTCAAEKHLVSEKLPLKLFFKSTGVVLAGIECSPKIRDFRASGIPVQERVDFFDTLRAPDRQL